MANDLFLILHGWGGNKPSHWQEHLAESLASAGKTVFYPKMPEPALPDLNAWLERLAVELAVIQDHIRDEAPDATLTVLAHSLGCINWLHYVSQLSVSHLSVSHLSVSQLSVSMPIADRVLLVAPPYIVPQLPPIDVPPSVAAFFPPPIAPTSCCPQPRSWSTPTYILPTVTTTCNWRGPRWPRRARLDRTWRFFGRSPSAWASTTRASAIRTTI